MSERRGFNAAIRLGAGAPRIYLLFLLMFPLFLVDRADAFGFDSLPTFAPSKLIRIAWFVLSAILSIGCVALTGSGRDASVRRPRSAELLLISYVALAWLSIGVNTPSSAVAWYRAAELALVCLGCVFIYRMTRLRGPEYPGRLFLYAATWPLATATLVLLAVGALDASMVVFSEVQGRERWGGYVYSANALAVYAVMAQAAVVPLWRRRQMSILAMLMISTLAHATVVLTDSRTGLALLALADGGLIGTLVLSKIGHALRVLFRACVIAMTVAIMGVVLASGPYRALLSAAQELGAGADPIGDVLTLNNRIPLFLTAAAGIGTAPILGVGYVEGVERFLGNNFSLSFWSPPHTHNAVLELLLAQGLVGSAPLLILLGISGVRASQALMFPERHSVHYVGVALILLIIITSGLLTVPLGNTVSPTTTFAFLAMLYLTDEQKMSQVRETEPSGARPAGTQERSARPSRTATALATSQGTVKAISDG